MFGYHGRYLRVDLTTGCSAWIPLPEEILRRFLGGVGLATYLLHREAPPGIDPYAPEAPLIFSLSPLVGTPLTTSAKFAVLAKSPLSERLNDSLSSSSFALAARRTGADAIVLVGCCATPSVLVIDEGQATLQEADDLWGLPIPTAADLLSERLGPRFATALIGPAGERLVRFATISHDRRHAGRGGLGAVMGSKRLKAVAVAGTQRVALAHPDAVMVLARDLSQRSFGPATAKYRELGTVANLLTFNRFAALPTRNFQEGTFDGVSALSLEDEQTIRRVARKSCAACTIGCEHLYAPTSAQTPDQEEPVRLEYETLFAFGPLCGVNDSAIVLKAARRCDQLGLDTISAGATIAFAMECAERGLFPVPGLRFGNGEAVLTLLDQIAIRDGPGGLLAEGTRRMASLLGGDAPLFAPHVKGLEIPGYEPRALQTMALGFAVGSRGADHNRSGAYEVDFSPHVDRLNGTPEAAQQAIETEDRAALLDSLILCKFLRGVFPDLFAECAALLHHVTGWDVTADELRTVGRRIVTAKKLYNIREGWTPAEDTLPARFLAEPTPSGAVLPAERLEAMKRAYYRGRQWDDKGYVPPEVLAALNLCDLSQGGTQ